MRALLALEDGKYFEGESFGATGTRVGEICFNTAMTGYQEVLTDPSYRGQIVAMTYPLIGNYQLARSGKPFAACPWVCDRRTERGAEQLAFGNVAR
jgi:carbamoylphosphate synthase small subunit